jgi:hypothetical protein
MIFAFLKYCLGNKVDINNIVVDINWQQLYTFAFKQSLLGFCFDGIKRLGNEYSEELKKNPIERDLLLTWMGAAQQIRRQNMKVNVVASKLYSMLREDGLRCCILKGQGNALMYPNVYSRNPGDIDVWVNANREQISKYAKKHFQIDDYRIIKRNPEMKDFEIGIFFSGLTRSLVNSDYNLRVYECKTAAWNVLAYQNQPLKEFNKTFLRDIPKESYEACKDRMPARFARRAEHFYSEYRRVRQGVTAWETGNLELFGKLCFDSCESSIHNYECGSPELIAIYEIMRSLEGVYGGRFSGAGFKGACIALVDPACKENVEKELTRQYLEKFPEYEKTFKVFWVKPDDGARFV